MSTPSSPDRSEIQSGTIYRRVAPVHLDSSGRPTFEAFRPRAVDKGKLSADTERKRAIENLRKERENGRLFILVAIDIESLKHETKGRAWVRMDKPGRSHVSVMGCENDLDVQQALARISEMVVLPG